MGLYRTQAIPASVMAMPTPEMKVQMAPPMRSQKMPQDMRMIEPMRGPRKAKVAPRTGRAREDSRPNWLLMSRPKTAEKPEKRPKVMT